MKNKSQGFLTILSIIIFIILVIILAYLAYTVYTNIPGKPENLNVDLTSDGQTNSTLSEVHQFHPNMKFNHNVISYYIYPDCDETKRRRMIEAFDILSQDVGLISFKEFPDNPDIEVSCSENSKNSQYTGKDYFIAGEGGAKEIIQTGKYNVITNATILLYDYQKNSAKCNFPNVELHELIHVFGFDHSQGPKSLMNPFLSSCDQKLDDSIINELKRLYSEPNLPDLYFENITAVKKGRYLDLNITIKNSGLIDSGNASLSIFEDTEILEDSNVENLGYGAGIIIRIENLKLSSTSPKEISFKLDKDNKIKELNKNNNIAKIKIS